MNLFSLASIKKIEHMDFPYFLKQIYSFDQPSKAGRVSQIGQRS